jgi:hypothetical protein
VAFVERPAGTLEPYGCRPRAPTGHSISRRGVVASSSPPEPTAHATGPTGWMFGISIPYQYETDKGHQSPDATDSKASPTVLRHHAGREPGGLRLPPQGCGPQVRQERGRAVESIREARLAGRPLHSPEGRPCTRRRFLDQAPGWISRQPVVAEDCHQSKQLTLFRLLQAVDLRFCAPGRTRTCNLRMEVDPQPSTPSRRVMSSLVRSVGPSTWSRPFVRSKPWWNVHQNDRRSQAPDPSPVIGVGLVAPGGADLLR